MSFLKKISSVEDLKKVFPPYYLQALILLGYNLVARYIFNFERPQWIFAMSISIGVALSYLIGKFIYKKNHSIFIALIVAFGGTLQMYSPLLWPYMLLPVFAVLSKATIRYKGRHIFNPSNFGLVCMFELFPHAVVGNSYVFSGYLGVAAIFFVLGSLNVLYARQAIVAFSWYVAFICFNYLRFKILGNAPFNFAYLAFNPIIILFTFHMVTDPVTVPVSKTGKILFGVGVALLDSILRGKNFPQSNYYALIICCSFLPLIWELESKISKNEILPRREYLK
ncbi:MAG: RnfABCDGE type electron transport complex subunit D [Bacteriovoracaceae bacterium]|nr:RnfABCDGE type electron transport complex subunit D [Bacteriovoracaceae bacterium]